MSKSKAIVFDLDDTLFLEQDYVRSGFRAVAGFVAKTESRDEEECFQQLWTLHESGQRGNTFDIWISQLQASQTVESLVKVYRQHSPDIRPIVGARDLLTSLKHEFALALLTDGHLSVQRAKLDALKLSESFDSVVFSDLFGRENWKPSPIPYQKALEPLGVQPDQAVYVGDNPTKDFFGARRVDMKSIRIRHDQGIYSELQPKSPDFEPDAEISSFGELPETVQKLLST